MQKVSRNASCPCGSGKKYKACCGTGDKSRSGVASSRILAIVVGLAVIGGAAIALNQFRYADQEPQPYVYDAENDRYWDPSPGHNHWHDGRPPANAGLVPTPPDADLPSLPPVEPAAAPAPVEGDPEPWAYDADNDRHWDPNTRTWATGMPPLEAFTSGN